MTDEDANLAAVYEQRNESMRAIIDALAERDDLDAWGVKAEVAQEIGVDEHRVYYVLDEWEELVQWRRASNRDPLDTDAVKEAYDDDTMRAMAESGEMVADGMGNIRVDVEFTLDEAFRAMKLLPSDLGMKVFREVIEDTDKVPKEGLDALFQDE